MSNTDYPDYLQEKMKEIGFQNAKEIQAQTSEIKLREAKTREAENQRVNEQISTHTNQPRQRDIFVCQYGIPFPDATPFPDVIRTLLTKQGYLVKVNFGLVTISWNNDAEISWNNDAEMQTVEQMQTILLINS